MAARDVWLRCALRLPAATLVIEIGFDGVFVIWLNSKKLAVLHLAGLKNAC